MRSAVVIASVIVGSVIPSQAFAQIDVLTARDPNVTPYYDGFGGAITSTYTFNTSMILNSVDFVTAWYGNGTPSYTLEYAVSSINNGAFQSVSVNDVNLAGESNDIRRFSLSNAVNLNAGDIVTVRTNNTSNSMGLFTIVKRFGAIDSNVNVSVVRNDGGRNATFSNSNLNVSPSNPSSNVAPEPGSFALALTGGAALIGICIRRRRNAA